MTEGEKGPREYEFVRLRVIEKIHSEPGRGSWLMARRPVRSGPDAEIKFFLSNAPETVALPEMAWVGCSIVHYADDAVILCRSEADAQHAYQWLQRTAQALKLVLHPDKTRIVDLRDGAHGFDFLGFHQHLVRSRKYGKWYCQRWPSGRAMAAIRARVKATTAPRFRLKQPIGNLVAELNPVLRGWCNYFRWGNSAKKFSQIDAYVWERLALFDSKKRQHAGRRWGTDHAYAWATGLGVYRLSGKVATPNPRQCAREHRRRAVWCVPTKL